MDAFCAWMFGEVTQLGSFCKSGQQRPETDFRDSGRILGMPFDVHSMPASWMWEQASPGPMDLRHRRADPKRLGGRNNGGGRQSTEVAGSFRGHRYAERRLVSEALSVPTAQHSIGVLPTAQRSQTLTTAP